MSGRMETEIWAESGNPWSARTSRASARKPGWRSPFPSGKSSSARWARRLRRSLRSLPHAGEQSGKHLPSPAVVAESVLVQVGLEPSARYAVVDPANPVLHHRPEALNGVRMHIAHDVDLLGVVNSRV